MMMSGTAPVLKGEAKSQSGKTFFMLSLLVLLSTTIVKPLYFLTIKPI
jgi:hypothetical protein